MEFFLLSKIYSDGTNSSAITVKSEHARLLLAFENHLMFNKHVPVHTKKTIYISVDT